MRSALLAIALAGLFSAPMILWAQGLPSENSRMADSCEEGSHDCRRPNTRRKLIRADCHRDVRTHRIGGIRIRHRHVGEDCTVREVTRGTSF